MSTTITIAVDFLELAGAVVGLASGFLGIVYLFGRLLIGQFSLRLDQRFKLLDERFKTRDDNALDLKRQIDRVEQHVIAVERDHLKLKVELPNEYVRREDWIRFSGTIDTKLDWLRDRFEATGQLIAKLMERHKAPENANGG